jgi:IS605 OrfB family transposase
MNRIYQGRVSKMQIENHEEASRKDLPWLQLAKEEGDAALWDHHCIFQDAVNYYLIALGALASPDAATSDRVILDLRTRLAESWDSFPRPNSKDKRSLKNSVCPWLGLGGDATLEDGFERILFNQDAQAALANSRALENLLAMLLEKKGDGKIRNGGATELPKFCCTKTNANFSGEHSRKALARLRLILAVHGRIECDLSNFGALDLATSSKRANRTNATGEEARKKLKQHAEKLLKAGWLSASFYEDSCREIQRLPAEEILPIPAYEAGGESREKSIGIPMLLLGKQLGFPQWSRDALKQLLAEPIKWEKALDDASAAAANSGDPLETARGKRGFVFRAFTALPAWNPVAPGEPAWKEFDIAAFKEALKALNQFKQKTDDRESTRLELEASRAWMLGNGGNPDPDGEEEERLPVLAGDARFDLAQALERDLTERLMLDPSAPFNISRAALRGFRDVAERWNQDQSRDPERLRKILTEYQADPKNQREIGSLPLMLALCETGYHPLWLAVDDEEAHRRELDGRAGDMLLAMCQLHQLETDLERARQPIRLTPAEPEASRRLYMFSDLSGRSAAKFKGDDSVEVSLALRTGGTVRECRTLLHFSAPRLKRDELTGGESSRWIQPMTGALGLSAPEGAARFQSAVALMPDRASDGSIRNLLNFPVDLEPDWIHKALGKFSTWKNQFNGTKDNNLHLHWPGTAKDPAKKNAWWENPAVIEDGFTVLSTDLGQRAAGAWALLKITCWKPETNRPVRVAGTSGERTWYAEVVRTGMYRLPGEEMTERNGSEWQRERYGASGRPATQDEFCAAMRMARDLGISEPEKWLGDEGAKSFPELNDALLTLANRRLSRLGTYHRWSCFRPETIENAARREKAVGNLCAELESYQDPEVLPWKEVAAAGDFEEFRHLTGRAFENLRDHLEQVLINLANRAVPVRHKLWVWRMRGGDCPYGDLVLEEYRDAMPKIRGQRGLSMKRLEQLENLRKVFLRYNRALDRKAGEPAKFGRGDAGRESGEPCQELLDKIDRMKEQRVNQTAHLILAQALGVRLKGHSMPEDERRRRDIHGEYEKIPGRQPVDFIVIEDLNRYRASQGRSPSENRGLMKWAHRAVRDKLKMLSEEPFGIPVVEVAAAYTSRFCGRTGEAGSRCEERGDLGYMAGILERKAEQKPSPGRTDMRTHFKTLLDQFRVIEEANAAVMTRNQSRGGGIKPDSVKTLLLPKPGGPLFVNIRDGQPVQADINAAVNIGLRAIAAPDALDLLHRIRGVREGDGPQFSWRPRFSEKDQANARERAGYDKASSIRMFGETSSKFHKTRMPNFFIANSPAFTVDAGVVDTGGKRLTVISGVALHSQCDGFVLDRILEINNARLKAWGLPTVPVTTKCERRGEQLPSSTRKIPEDDIPL